MFSYTIRALPALSGKKYIMSKLNRIEESYDRSLKAEERSRDNRNRKGAVISSSSMPFSTNVIFKPERNVESCTLATGNKEEANPKDMYLPITRSDAHCRLHPAGQACQVSWQLNL